MGKFITFIINVFRGMNSYISNSNLPSYILQHIENYSLTSKFGYLRKRKGNKKVIDSGITSLKAIGEFEDVNGGIQLLIQDGTGLKESVYSGGSYTDPVTSITNDKRISGSLVDEMYPIIYNHALRSPAGVVSSAYRSFLYAYYEEAVLFPDAAGEETLSAGKYLTDRFQSVFDAYVTVDLAPDSVDLYAGSSGKNLYGLSDSLDKPWETTAKVVYISAFTFDGQRLPAERVSSIAYFDGILDAPVSLHITIGISSLVDSSEFRNIKGVDVFIADFDKVGGNKEYPAYFLQRVDFTESESEAILRQSGTFEAASPPTYIEFDKAAEDWESFNLENYYIKFTHSGTDYVYKLSSRTYTNAAGEKVRYSVSADSALNGVTVDCEIVSKFVGDPGSFRIVYDNYYKQLGSEMYTYLNAPDGDLGLDDYTHKYGCIAGDRYFGFGFSNGFGYFSPPYYYDVLYAQNIIKPLKAVTGCVSYGADVIIFYKDGASLVSVLSNANVAQNDSFMDVGLVGQRALFKLSDYEIFIMTYKGPYLISGRSRKFIGQSIKTWFTKTVDKPYLSSTTIETCVVAYNYLEDTIDYIFQGSYVGDSGDYPDGITFVFDMNAFREGLEPWTIKNTNATMNCAAQSVKGHLLTGSTGNDVYDWNDDNPDETFGTKLKIKLLKNDTFSKRRKMIFGRLFADIETDDTVTAKVYFDEADSPTIQSSLNSEGELPVNYIKESMEVEFTTGGSANDVETRGIGIKLKPKRH